KPRPIPRLDKLDTAGLVAALDSPNGWQRDMAQMMLLWRNDKSAVPHLKKLALEGKRPLARLHALCTLDGLDGLTPRLLLKALADVHPGVRRHAVRLCEPRAKLYTGFISADLAKLADDPDPQVRVQLAYTLGEWADNRAARPLALLIIGNAGDRYLKAATLSSIHKGNLNRVPNLVLGATDDGVVALGVFDELAQLAVGLQDTWAIITLLLEVTDSERGSPAAWQFAALAGLLDALDRRGGSLATLKKDGGEEMMEAIENLERLFAAGRSLVKNNNAPDAVRVQAVRVLGRGFDRQEED